VVSVLTNIIIGMAIDPTSHNLFPFEIVFYCFPSLIFLWFVVQQHKKYGKSDKPHE
jgi:hypothetical protein